MCRLMVCVGALLYICEGMCLLCALLVCASAPGAHQQPLALKCVVGI